MGGQDLDAYIRESEEAGESTTGIDEMVAHLRALMDEMEGMLMRIRAFERKVARQCDVVSSQAEGVVRPLQGNLSGTPGHGGAAVLGDGNIARLLDVVTLYMSSPNMRRTDR